MLLIVSVIAYGVHEIYDEYYDDDDHHDDRRDNDRRGDNDHYFKGFFRDNDHNERRD